MDAKEVLVFLEHDAVRSAVVRDPFGQLWLTDSPGRIQGTILSDYRPRHVGLTGDRTLLGGRLAPGAVRAEVVDDAGQRHRATAANGAWIAMLNQPILGPMSPVCCRNADDEPVAPPLPVGWVRSRVTDATESCPACGYVIWDQLISSDDSHRSGARTQIRQAPNVIVACRTCGHEESIGAIVHLRTSDNQNDNDAARRIRAARVRICEQKRELLAGLDFPIYAADGWAAALVGSGASSGATNRVTVAHGVRADQPGPALHVQTAQNEQFAPTQYLRARRELERWLLAEQQTLPTGRSDAGFTIACRTHDWHRRQTAAKSAHAQTLIQIDGKPEPFTILRAGTRWVGVRQRAKETITVAANEIDPATINLKAITNPIQLLLPEPGE